MKRFLLFSAISILCLTISAQTKTWVGPTGGLYSVSSNWNPVGVPNDANDVIFPTGSNVIINVSANIKSFTLQGNATVNTPSGISFTGVSTIAANATFNWSEGYFYGSGTWTNNGTINLTGNAGKSIGNSIMLVNNGTINYNSTGEFYLGFGSPILNNAATGIINFNTNTYFSGQQGAGTLVNSGLIRKQQGSGLFNINVPFQNNNGTISVETGTLQLNSSSTTLTDGIYNVTSGNTLEWANNFTLLGTLTGQLDGQINWTGTLNVATATEAILDFDGPTGVNWTSGYLQGDGTLTNRGILNFDSENAKFIAGQTDLKNEGIINYNGVGGVALGFGSPTLTNTTSGVINLNKDSSFSGNQGAGTVVNFGLLRRQQSSGLFQIGIPFQNNNGTVSVETGTLQLNSSNTTLTDGIYNVTSGNTLEWANSFTLLGTLTGQLDGQINWTGILDVVDGTEANLNFNGSTGVNWTSGYLQGDGTLTNSGILNFVSENAKFIAGQTDLKNEGIINFNGVGGVALGFGSPTLTNSTSGVINLNTDSSFSGNQGAGTVVNFGLLTRQQSSGLFTIGIPFQNNNGTVSVETGTLQLNSSNTTLTDGIYNVTSGNTLEWANSFTLLGTLTGQLDGQINWTGTLNVATATEAILDFEGPTGVNWTSGFLQGDGTLTNRGILNFISENAKFIAGQTDLKNEGIINYDGVGGVALGFGSPTLTNTTSGVINLNSDTSFSGIQGAGTVVNFGLIIKEQTSGTFSFSTNNNNMSPGSIISKNGLISFGNYEGNGTIGGNASVQFQGGTIFEGIISPGSSPGILTVVSNYNSSPAAILDIEINGPNSGTDFDVLSVQGNADLNGGINLTMGYVANVNDEFVILTAPTISTCNLPATVSGTFNNMKHTFDVICNPTNVTLKVNSIILGTIENTLKNLTLYPNPSNGQFTIDLGRDYNGVTVQILNMLGQIISSEKYATAKMITQQINASEGMYFIKVSTANEGSTTLRIVKQ